ncbi:MAG: proteasome subunit beta [Desulfurococcaceae archaeon]|jgi:proteasome beta subunit|nr:proteasome subunit beta [Desulfurococcaceae archaeon]
MNNVESKTTTVGLVVGDTVILAADKRATAGTAVYHKTVKKILKINNYSAMTISGLVADAQFLVENARALSRRYELQLKKPIEIKSLANYLSLLLSIYLRAYPFLVQLLLGGYDSNGPSLYYLDLYGTLTREKYMSTGSGSPIALGVLESSYRENMDLEEAKKLAVKAVISALSRDGFSGEGVDVVVISKDGIREESIQLRKTLS